MRVNNIIKSSVQWFVAAATLLLAPSCADKFDDSTPFGEGEGCVELAIELNETRSEGGNLLDNSILKIYDGANRLVRRYEPATEMPESIYILAGDYTATLIVGDEVAATKERAEFSYYGDCKFTVKELSTTEIALDCPMLNSVVEVTFGESLRSAIKSGYKLQMVSVADGESFSEEAYEDAHSINMEFTEDGEGYFIIPEGENLAWSFTGEKVKSTGETEPVSGSGIIAAPEARKQYSLTFNYSTYLEVSSIQIDVDTSTDDQDDSMDFTPQPIISPDGFQLEESHTPGDFTLSITGLNILSQVEVVAGETTIYPLAGGNVASVEGATYTKIDDMNGTLTLTADLFGNYAFGGNQSATIKVTDIVNSTKTATMAMTTTGITTLTNPDYWANTATISAMVIEESPSVVTIEYRNPGATEWYSATATKGEGNIYSITTAADWSESTNSAAKIYSLAFGISPANSYECRVTVDGKSQPAATLTTDNSGVQTIANSAVQKGLDCYKNNESKSSTSWCSGNNKYAYTLCTYGAYEGEGCAYLASSTAVGKFAAGNLVFGQFNFSGTSGTMSFGQPFTWKSRPKSLKVKYAANVNKVGDYDYSKVLKSGDIDPARIFVAIVDWSSRHGVTAGTSGTASNIWNPETQTSTGEGKIIGYGSLFIRTTTTASTLQDAEIEIFYYDKTSKPDGAITLVISCAASAYGDYFAGSTLNRLWVKDFEFGY